eukprot:s8167_g1.t1
MRKWVEKALELSDSEMEYKSALPDHCRSTLAKKKILLFRDLLVEAEHTDMDIVKHMSQGFDLAPCAKALGGLLEAGLLEATFAVSFALLTSSSPDRDPLLIENDQGDC